MPLLVPADALTTIYKVKRYGGINLSDTSSDDLINELITEVTAYIKSYCGGREFLSKSYTEVYDTKHGRHKIFLRQMPVTAVDSVKYRSGTPTAPVWVTFDANGYLTYLKQGYIHFYGALPEAPQGMQVTYTAGYLINFSEEADTAHTLPADITIAANEIIVTILNTSKAGGITNETTEGQSVTYDFKKGLTDTAKNILDAYKIIRIAR